MTRMHRIFTSLQSIGLIIAFIAEIIGTFFKGTVPPISDDRLQTVSVTEHENCIRR